MSNNPFTAALEQLLTSGAAPDDAISAVIPEPTAPPEDELAALRERYRVEDERVLTSRYVTAGWPLRAVEAAIAPQLTNAVQRMRAWKADIAVLAGGPGLGKTVAAAAWMRETGRFIRFVRASTFETMSKYGNEDRTRLFTAPGLCLDDLGAEYVDNKGSFLSNLDELIDTYYADQRPLIITTNLTAAEFKTRYGKRIEDRIRECGEWMTVTGNSMRGGQ